MSAMRQPTADPFVGVARQIAATAPRNRLVSGGHPIDPFFTARPEKLRLDAIEAAVAQTGRCRAGS